MRVALYKLVKRRPEKICTLTLTENGITVDRDDCEIAHHVLRRPVIVPGKMEKVYAKDDPKKFLENLQYRYTGAYFFAGAPE